MKVLKSIFRRKVRALLTISGIAIGIFALVVMGSMAEKLNRLVSGGVEYYGTRITVQDAKAQFGFFGTNPISISKIDEIEKVDGVKSAYASISMLLEEVEAVNFGMPPMIGGGDPRQDKDEPFKISYSKGRAIREGDHRKVVIGQDLLRELKVDVGDEIKLRDEKFEVVGIIEKTFTAPDNMAIVNLPDAQELFLGDIPAAYRAKVKKEDLATSIEVFVKEGVDPNFVVEKINGSVSDVKAISPDEFEEQVASQTAIFNLIILGSAIIALIVGSFSIINTMIMSVTERIREIGIKKAIGASNARILREFITEAAIMGLMGGLIGLAFGWGAVKLINSIMAESGQIIFLTTPRLAIGSVVFATILGAVAGLYPAWYAARLNPIQALRSE